MPSSAPHAENSHAQKFHAGGVGDTSAVSDTSSIKGELAQGLDEMRGRLSGLQERLHKKKAAISHQAM